MPFCYLLLSAMLPLAAQTGGSFLLRGGTVHTVSGPDIPGGSVLVRDGRITDVGPKLAAPKGVRVIDVKGLHVYPGLIDSATQLGATEIGSVRETSDVMDLGVFKPQLRIAAALNPASEHLPVTRANGVTTAVVQPSGGIIPGQAALIHLDGWTTEEMLIMPAVAMRLDYPHKQPGGGGVPFAELKKQYEAQVRELNEYFESARRYQKAKAVAAPDFKTDLALEAMLPVLEGRLPLLVRAEREKTIREAIAFAEKQKVRMILQQAVECWKVAAELKAKGIMVTLARTLSLPSDEDEPYDRPFTTPAELFKAGVKFSFATYGPGAGNNPSNLPYEAAAAVPFGLSPEEALKAVTLNAAAIWGVEDQIGSIDRNKLADLIVTDGDPLETRTHVLQMFINGRPVDLNNKHKRLYEKFVNRP
ncbi:MAG TPA: amidohydrolase family protein [Bryobacteraceae bacterium]|nr:amidohydrolase family protein [Bryobacteraceae bacterium]